MIWNFGDVSKDVPPYRKLHAKDVPKQKMVLSRAVGVIKELLKAGSRDVEKIATLTVDSNTCFVDDCMIALITKFRFDSRAARCWTFTTMYQNLNKKSSSSAIH